MILFKCSCGTGLKVSDEQAGERFICPSCMQEVSAPAESEADCVLIYQDGGPADGFVIDRQNLENKITNRELGAWDLIWQDDNWIPLGTVYQFQEEAPPEEDADLTEIALNFSDLPPVEGYARLPRNKNDKHLSGGKNGRASGKGAVSRFRELSAAGRVFFILKLIVVLLILGYGLYRTMKMVNFLKDRPETGQILKMDSGSGNVFWTAGG